MSLKEDFERLVDAHRALAAQHTALMAVCRVMLPLIDAHPGDVRHLLLTAYDAYSEHMDNAGQDDAYQAEVRAGIDLLSKTILSAADTRDRRGSSPEGRG